MGTRGSLKNWGWRDRKKLQYGHLIRPGRKPCSAPPSAIVRQPIHPNHSVSSLFCCPLQASCTEGVLRISGSKRSAESHARDFTKHARTCGQRAVPFSAESAQLCQQFARRLRQNIALGGRSSSDSAEKGGVRSIRAGQLQRRGIPSCLRGMSALDSLSKAALPGRQHGCPTRCIRRPRAITHHPVTTTLRIRLLLRQTIAHSQNPFTFLRPRNDFKLHTSSLQASHFKLASFTLQEMSHFKLASFTLQEMPLQPCTHSSRHHEIEARRHTHANHPCTHLLLASVTASQTRV